jgi:hypothetical protein
MVLPSKRQYYLLKIQNNIIVCTHGRDAMLGVSCEMNTEMQGIAMNKERCKAFNTERRQAFNTEIRQAFNTERRQAWR